MSIDKPDIKLEKFNCLGNYKDGIYDIDTTSADFLRLIDPRLVAGPFGRNAAIDLYISSMKDILFETLRIPVNVYYNKSLYAHTPSPFYKNIDFYFLKNDSGIFPRLNGNRIIQLSINVGADRMNHNTITFYDSNQGIFDKVKSISDDFAKLMNLECRVDDSQENPEKLLSYMHREFNPL